LSDNKITHAARIRSLQELPSQVLNDIRRVEIARAEHRLAKLKQAFGEDQTDIDVAFEADGLSWSAAKIGKGWEPGGIEP